MHFHGLGKGGKHVHEALTDFVNLNPKYFVDFAIVKLVFAY